MAIVKQLREPTGPIQVPVRRAADSPGPASGDNNNYLPRRRPPAEEPGKKRDVTCCQPYWLDMVVDFTSTAGEQQQAATEMQNFPMSIRGAWTNLQDVRVQLASSQFGSTWNAQQVPILSVAGASDLVHPMLYWRRPFPLDANHIITGVFTNDGAEPAGNLVFFAEKTEEQLIVTVEETATYWNLIDLGLSGGASGVGKPFTAPLEFPLLVYGILSTSTGMTLRIVDTSNGYAWSQEELPVGAYAGIQNPGTTVQPIIYFPRPYFLKPNASLRAEWTNAGAETGKFLSFLCEKVVR